MSLVGKGSVNVTISCFFLQLGTMYHYTKGHSFLTYLLICFLLPMSHTELPIPDKHNLMENQSQLNQGHSSSDLILEEDGVKDGSNRQGYGDVTVDYFLDELMKKYGDGKDMSFEGFEHLLNKLKLANILYIDHHIDCHKSKNSSDFISFHSDHNHHDHSQEGTLQASSDSHVNCPIEGDHVHDHGDEDDHAHDDGHEDDHAHNHGDEDDHAHDHGDEDDHAHDHGDEDDHAHDHGDKDDHAHDHGDEDDHAHNHGDKDDHAHDHGDEDDHVHNHGDEDDHAHNHGDEVDHTHNHGDEDDHAHDHGDKDDHAHNHGDKDDNQYNHHHEGEDDHDHVDEEDHQHRHDHDENEHGHNHDNEGEDDHGHQHNHESTDATPSKKSRKHRTVGEEGYSEVNFINSLHNPNF